MITHESPEYMRLWKNLGRNKYNGCWFYSQEIVKNIIPNVQTKRDWNTVGREFNDMHDGMIVFLHDNATPWHYSWLQKYNDLVLVCSSQYTANSVKYWGHIINLPMSIDVEYVKQFRVPEKTKDVCFVGNRWVQLEARNLKLPENIEFLTSLPREELLKEMAKFRKAYAIDRCAQEAVVLGCELQELDTRYSVDNVGEVLDNREAAKILQEKLNEIERSQNEQSN